MRPALLHIRALLNHDALQTSRLALARAVRSRGSIAASPARILPTSFFKNISTFKSALHTETIASPVVTVPLIHKSLPRACPGCGAPSQIYDKDEAGHYSVTRKTVRDFLGWNANKTLEITKEDNIFAKALELATPNILKELQPEDEAAAGGKQPEDNLKTQNHDAPLETPVCDRCHNLIHHHVGVPIQHPSVDAIHQTIAESPHRRNHIYHVLDAADFPLSIIPNLQSSLRIPKLRTQNRRAKHKGWVANDRIAEVSFIITRSDLLAPKKEQVDALLPYFKEVLREALGRVNSKARLGNVRLVSAKRGWWTKEVKEDIWERGGAGWMVGKVNVGKSNLFEVVFPKGRGADYQEIRKIRSATERERMLSQAKSIDELTKVQQQLAEEDAETEKLRKKQQESLSKSLEDIEEQKPEIEEEEDIDDPDALLPPAQPYTQFPVLPIISSLPGTTASPIRIPFGRNKGELVDLPGVARTVPGLEVFVKPTEHESLVMANRINSERFSLKPGQSLILGGGLIRITPVTQDLVFIVHPFVPIHPHVTRTEKAITYQAQTSDRQLQHPPILADDIGHKMRSAGIFPLKWDVTKKLAGPLTSSVAGKMRPENLPFRIWGTDILLEGIGWIEVSAQTRKPQGWKPIGLEKKDPNHAQHALRASREKEAAYKDRKYAAIRRAEEQGADPQDALSAEFAQEETFDDAADAFEDCPEVEVFSPLGKFIGQRRPMCASLVSGPKYVASRDRQVRPRRSMVSVKRQRKPMSK